MNKLAEPVTVESVLDEIEDEITLVGAAHAAPPRRVRSRAAIPMALIVPAIFFGGLVIVLLLRGDPIAAIRGSRSAAIPPASPDVSLVAGVRDRAPTAESIAKGEGTEAIALAARSAAAATTSEDFSVQESQSALLRFMARGTVKELPAPRRAGSAAPADAAAAPANTDVSGRAAIAAASSGNAANSAAVANAASGVANANVNPANAPAASKGAVATDARAAAGADGASTVQIVAQTAQPVATPSVATGAASSAAPGAAASAAPIAATVIPTPPPAPLRPIERPSPVFPVDAMRDGIRSGRVLAALTVAPDGSVSDVRVLEFAPNVSFSRSAQRALRNWRFAATGTGGQATIELLFRSEE